MKKFAPILIPFFVSCVIALSVIIVTTLTSYIALTPEQKIVAEQQRQDRETAEKESRYQEQADKVQEILLGDRYKTYRSYTFTEPVNPGYGTGQYSLEETIQNYKNWTENPANFKIADYAVFRILVGTQREMFSPITGENIMIASENNKGSDTTLVMQDNNTSQACKITLPAFTSTCSYLNPDKDPNLKTETTQPEEKNE